MSAVCRRPRPHVLYAPRHRGSAAAPCSACSSSCSDRRRPHLVRAPPAGLLPGPLRAQPRRPRRPAAGPRRHVKILIKEDWIPPFADRTPVHRRAGDHARSRCCSRSWSCRWPAAFVVADINIGLLFFLGDVVARRLQRGPRRLVVAQQVLARRRPARRRPDGELRGLHGPLADRAWCCMAGSFDLNAHRRGPARPLVRRAAVPRLRRLPARRLRRDAAHPVRPGRGRKRARGRLPHRVLGHEVRPVPGRRVPRPSRSSRRSSSRCSSAAGWARGCPASSGSCSRRFIFIIFFILVRGTLPRPRYDQLMELGWKILLPLAWSTCS